MHETTSARNLTNNRHEPNTNKVEKDATQSNGDRVYPKDQRHVAMAERNTLHDGSNV
jgi:hypothetical protein